MIIDDKIEINLLNVMLLVETLKLLKLSIKNFSIENIIKRLIASKSFIERYRTSCEAINANAKNNYVNVISIE